MFTSEVTGIDQKMYIISRDNVFTTEETSQSIYDCCRWRVFANCHVLKVYVLSAIVNV